MKVVVVGGSGRIGSRVITILRRAGHDVVAASRRTGADVITSDDHDLTLTSRVSDAASGCEKPREAVDDRPPS